MTAPVYEFGPIQVFVIAFEGTGPDPAVLRAIDVLDRDGQVRLVDMIVGVRTDEGEIAITEPTALGAEGGLGELAAEGLIAEEDVIDSLADASPGQGVAIAAFEMRWATELASALAAANGRVVELGLLPAPQVQALVDAGRAAQTTQED